MTDPAEFADRPRRRLLELLERRQINYADFAMSVGMASEPENWSSGRSREEEWRQRARVALRKYTHGMPDPSDPNGERRIYRQPGLDLICRWATELKVDPGYFWSRGRPRKYQRKVPAGMRRS